MNRAAFLKGMVALTGAALVGCGDDESADNSGSGGQTSTATNSGGNSAGGNGAGGNSAGGNSAGGSSAGSCGAALLVMGSNYGTDPHDLSIPLADLEAGVTKTYTTTGNGHTHDVTLSDADFAALRNGELVTKYTCYTNPNNTDHEWAISCADPNVMPMRNGEIGTDGNCPA